jgi:hemoglobin-like flavoprotein
MADPHWVMLDENEVGLVKSSWSKVKFNEIDILYYILKKYPNIQAKFPMFAGKDLDTLKDTGKFAVHAGRIVNFITNYIDLLGPNGNQPAIKTVLNEMGSNHKDRGISKTLFNEFRTAFMAYMKENVSWGDNVEHAWNDAFDKMYYVIFSNLDGAPVN